uniref:Uncharacterized protein n=1 Tax=Tetranychus urticae TaxID=32264 RepID=T1KBD7_TETUR
MHKPNFQPHSNNSVHDMPHHHHQQFHSDHSRFKDPDFDCNRDKLWFQKLKNFLIVAEDDLHYKATKIGKIREDGSHLKSRSSRLIFKEVEDKLAQLQKSMDNFYVFLNEMNNLEIKYDAIVYDCDTQQTPKKPTNEIIHDSTNTSECGNIDSGSLTDSMQHVGNTILNGISESDPIFSDFFSSPIAASVASSFSLTFTTPKSGKINTDSPLKTPLHGYDVVRDLIKEFQSVEEQPSSPLASSSTCNIPSDTPVAPVLKFDFLVNETQTTTPATTQSDPQTNRNPENNDCTYVVTQAKSAMIASPSGSETRKVFRSKRFNLDKFRNYNAIGLKKKRGRENNPEVAMVTTIEKVDDESSAVVKYDPKTSKSMTPQLLKTMNVDEFLSQVHQKLIN